MEQLGELFGWLTLIFVGSALLNFILKFAKKNFPEQIGKINHGNDIMKFLMNIFVKNHKLFGMGAVVFVLTHFIIQFTRGEIRISGYIAAGILILMAIGGIILYAKKLNRKSLIFKLHRASGFILGFAIIAHLLLK